MKLIKVDNQEKDLGTYTWQKVTFETPNGRLIKYEQIRKVVGELQKKLPKGATIVVEGMNILRGTNLFSSYKKGNVWKSDVEYDEYLGELGLSREDGEKFDAFYNFTVTVRLPKENFT